MPLRLLAVRIPILVSAPSIEISSGSDTHLAGFYRGVKDMHKEELPPDHPGMRAEGGAKRENLDRYTAYKPPATPEHIKLAEAGTLLPATVYSMPNRSADKVAMLDSRPVTKGQNSSGSRSPIFTEHLAEMDDTSISGRPHPSQLSPASSSDDSPTLGRDSGFSADGNMTYLHGAKGRNLSLADDVRNRQHMMSWNTYDEKEAASAPHEMGSGMASPKSPPTQRQQSPDVSPDHSSIPIDRGFVVSPFGSLERSDRAGAGRH